MSRLRGSSILELFPQLIHFLEKVDRLESDTGIIMLEEKWTTRSGYGLPPLR
jgi:hypothetical protein